MLPLASLFFALAPLDGGAAVDAGLIFPADLLRRAAAGADRLVVTDHPFEGRKVRTLTTVDGAAEIAAFLKMIDVPPVPAAHAMHHMCVGSPPIKLFRGKTLLAEFSFDHASMLRAVSNNLWASDVKLTASSARAMAEWFKAHGYGAYADEIASDDEENALWENFYSQFPPQLRAALEKVDNGMRTFVAGSSGGEASDAGASEVLDPVARAIPDEVERLQRISRGLGLVSFSWTAYSQQEELLMNATANVSAANLVKALESFPQGSLELRGATRVFFGAPIGGTSWLYRLEEPAANRLINLLAPLVFANEPENATDLPLILRSFRTEQVVKLLQTESAKLGSVVESTRCGAVTASEAPFGALIVLASWKKVLPPELKVARSRAWKCGVNAAAASTAVALVEDRLPTAKQLEDSDLTTAYVLLERLKQRPTRKAIDLVVAALLEHPSWGVREEAGRWLISLSGLDLREQPEPAHQLKDWWSRSRGKFEPKQ